MIPPDDLGEGLDVAIDDLVARDVGVAGIARGRLHDDEPVLEVAPVEEDGLLGRAVAPVGGRIPQRGRRRLGREAPHPGTGRRRHRRREEARGRGERAEERGEAAGCGRGGERRERRAGEEERARRRRHGGSKTVGGDESAEMRRGGQGLSRIIGRGSWVWGRNIRRLGPCGLSFSVGPYISFFGAHVAFSFFYLSHDDLFC